MKSHKEVCGQRLPSARSEEVRTSWMKKRKSILGKVKTERNVPKMGKFDVLDKHMKDSGLKFREYQGECMRRGPRNKH